MEQSPCLGCGMRDGDLGCYCAPSDRPFPCPLEDDVRPVLESRYRLFGLHEEKGQWVGTVALVCEQGSGVTYFESCTLHQFTAEELHRIFTPLGGIRAVGDRFYWKYFGMEVTL